MSSCPFAASLSSPPSLFIPLCCYFLPTLWHQNLLRQATANAVPSRALATPASLPARPPACVCVRCVCLLACSRYSYIYSFAQCFCSLFVCATSCLSPAPLSLSPSLPSFVVLSVPFRALSFLLSAYCRRLPFHASHFVCLATINV